MSYSIQEAKSELALEIEHAKRDINAPDKLRDIATRVKKDGEDELAEYLINCASRIENAYDEANDN